MYVKSLQTWGHSPLWRAGKHLQMCVSTRARRPPLSDAHKPLRRRPVSTRLNLRGSIGRVQVSLLSRWELRFRWDVTVKGGAVERTNTGVLRGFWCSPFPLFRLPVLWEFNLWPWATTCNNLVDCIIVGSVWRIVSELPSKGDVWKTWGCCGTRLGGKK